MSDPREYWDAVGEQFQAADGNELWRQHSDGVNRSWLDRLLPNRAQRVLKTDLFEESIGDGLCRHLQKSTEVVCGIDVSITTARAAQRRTGGVRAVVADVRQLPFADGSFDCIVSISTLDHFESQEDIRTSLRELARCLACEGVLLITLDNAANPCVWIRNALPFRLLNRIGLIPYFVGDTCAPRRLRRYLTEVGLTVRDVSAIMHCPRVAAVATARILSRFKGKRKWGGFLRLLMAFEHLSRLPTRFLTGYFVAMRAIKR